MPQLTKVKTYFAKPTSLTISLQWKTTVLIRTKNPSIWTSAAIMLRYCMMPARPFFHIQYLSSFNINKVMNNENINIKYCPSAL